MWRAGRRAAAGPVAVRVCPNEGAGVRLAVAVSRRLGKAVVRNRIRRRLREAFRAEAGTLREDLDVVVTALAGSEQADFWALRAALRAALRKAGACSD